MRGEKSPYLLGLLIDWDPEAPGLHRYLWPFLVDPELTSSPGVPRNRAGERYLVLRGFPRSNTFLYPLLDKLPQLRLNRRDVLSILQRKIDVATNIRGQLRSILADD